MRYRKPIVLYLVAAIVAVIMSALGGADILPSQDSAVHANGFTVPLVEGDSGPYKYLVGIWPAEPVVGNLHMAIALTSEQGPVTGAAVDVRGRIGRNGLLSDPVPAPGYFLQRWSYELDMNLREPGQWTFEIKINSSLGETVLEVGSGWRSWPADGRTPEGRLGLFESNGPNWALIAAAAGVLALGTGGWILMRRQRAGSGTDGTHQTRSNRRRRRS
ncbi:MAG: hypothetical protein CL895_02465 [Dehalococcoidia bacterium]|nr:hypothetical protein [Dehalococcoidia bacterium]